MDSPTNRVTRSTRRAGAGKVVPEPKSPTRSKVAVVANASPCRSRGRPPAKMGVALTPTTTSTATTPLPLVPVSSQSQDSSPPFIPVQSGPTQSNPIFIIQVQQPSPNSGSQNIGAPISSVGSFPTFVSTDVQNTAGNTGIVKPGNLFTSGRNSNEVVIIFQSLSAYMANNLSGFAPDWHYAITTGSKRTDYTLNIYELKSTPLGLSLPRTIQMFMDQTIRIVVHSKDGTKEIIGNARIETPENLKELILKIRRTSLCDGCRDFGDSKISCQKGVKEGKTWYSVNCNRLVTLKRFEEEEDAVTHKSSTQNRICKHCALIKLALGKQATRKRRRMDGDGGKDKGKPVTKTDIANPGREKLNVRNIIQDKLETVWSSLGFDEAARKWKEDNLSKSKPKPKAQQLPTTPPKQVSQKLLSSNTNFHIRSPFRAVAEVQSEDATLDSDTEELMDI